FRQPREPIATYTNHSKTYGSEVPPSCTPHVVYDTRRVFLLMKSIRMNCPSLPTPPCNKSTRLPPEHVAAHNVAARVDPEPAGRGRSREVNRDIPPVQRLHKTV